MYLHRLVYYSENKIRDLGLPLAKELKAIVLSGQKNNPAAGITGVLAFNDQYFVGVIEGDRRRLSSLLMRIARDKRAANLTVLSAGEIDERRFDDWTSVYAGHSETVDRLYLRFGLTQGLDPGRMSADSLFALLDALSRLEAGQLARHPTSATEHGEVIKVTTVFAGGSQEPRKPLETVAR
ncbi:BLUF domain-containing protein [Chthonobacter rhizosphaerae]|uniref:BLUF domain-containing protein n=1 Tax=Chthonobacter rhizosphaerae TaxID=2735553 RepID=UPI0015EE9073|nr:BLUF domain-containing protein [Chthonobacter rhizosphaerae]